ncbi:hypothetical protein NO2_0254 [Candidatus Termititenax persephonae]|uniref:Phage tail fiber protein n=1 Tax=Candidatus Termititenax persephonae TaxID=2218525 RepID=A0A388TEZ4_9BACT|nr:hypothetical protein NO2_0254 [Candidatus Termititenax persephonae]
MAGNYSRTYDGIAKGSSLSAAKTCAALNLLEQTAYRDTTVGSSADRYPTVKAIQDAGLEGEINARAADSAVLHRTDNKTETISVAKTFTAMPSVPIKASTPGNNLTTIATEAQLYNVYNGTEKTGNKKSTITASSTNTEYPTCSAVSNALNTVIGLIKNEITFYPSDLYTASSTKLPVNRTTRTITWNIGTIRSKDVKKTTILDGGYAMLGHITCCAPQENMVFTVYTTSNGNAHSGQSATLTIDIYGRVMLSNVLYCTAHPGIATIYYNTSISWTY